MLKLLQPDIIALRMALIAYGFSIGDMMMLDVNGIDRVCSFEKTPNTNVQRLQSELLMQEVKCSIFTWPWGCASAVLVKFQDVLLQFYGGRRKDYVGRRKEYEWPKNLRAANRGCEAVKRTRTDSWKRKKRCSFSMNSVCLLDNFSQVVPQVNDDTSITLSLSYPEDEHVAVNFLKLSSLCQSTAYIFGSSSWIETFVVLGYHSIIQGVVNIGVLSRNLTMKCWVESDGSFWIPTR